MIAKVQGFLFFAVQPRPTHRRGLYGAPEIGVKKKELARCEQNKRHQEFNSPFTPAECTVLKGTHNVPCICFQRCLHPR